MKVVLSLVALLAAGLVPARAHAQTSTAAVTRHAQARPDATVERLLAALSGKDEKAADEAASALVKRGDGAVPSLERFLKAEGKEAGRLRAAQVLARIRPEHPAVVPALLSIAKGRGFFDSQEALLMRRAAGMSLALTPAGLRALPTLLKDDDAFVRRSAAFAFDERTEALDSLTPEMSEALGEALPALVGALDDVDEVVRGMACEALVQLVRGRIEPLSNRAEGLLKRGGRARGRCLCECE